MVRYNQSTVYTIWLLDRLASSHSASYFSISAPQKRRNPHNTICFKGHIDWSWALTAIQKSMTWVALMNEEHEVKTIWEENTEETLCREDYKFGTGPSAQNKEQDAGSLILRVGVDGSYQEAPFNMSSRRFPISKAGLLKC